MAEVKTHVVTNKSLFLGNNEFESGILTVPVGKTVPAGALLKRVSGGFSAVVNTNTLEITVPDGEGTQNVPIPGVPIDYPIAVNPEEVKNDGSTVNIPIRALISGKVRADMLKKNATEDYTFEDPVNVNDLDLIRSFGIIAVKVTDVSWAEE
jgi:hypothetical protein